MAEARSPKSPQAQDKAATEEKLKLPKLHFFDASADSAQQNSEFSKDVTRIR